VEELRSLPPKVFIIREKHAVEAAEQEHLLEGAAPEPEKDTDTRNGIVGFVDLQLAVSMLIMQGRQLLLL
jgi:hypothetical protein